MKLHVSVQLPTGAEVVAGIVEDIGGRDRSRAATVTFAYAPGYLASPDAYPLAPSLPLSPGAFTPSGTRSTLPGLADAQPDLWGRRLIESANRRRARGLGVVPARSTEVEVLAAVPDSTRQGSLRFRRDEDGTPVAAVPLVLPDRDGELGDGV